MGWPLSGVRSRTGLTSTGTIFEIASVSAAGGGERAFVHRAVHAHVAGLRYKIGRAHV